jgi:S1-C subfamily serine protease
MRKPLYSSPHRRVQIPVEKPRGRTWRELYTRHERRILFAAIALLAVLVVSSRAAFAPAPREITQEDIDAAVLRTLQEKSLPSSARKAYEAVRHAIVRVRAIGDGLEYDDYAQRAVGSGVVIVDRGVILTNLHVVAGSSRIRVTFADGHESEAQITGTQPENDLAVLQALQIPDDLAAATLGSAAKLAPGDEVVAVGFPFGIGPSVTAGVVSGLKREYRSPAGDSVLTDLIQFDAAANPGSSGGPLVNAAGEVVGIVTAILGTGELGSFAGIAFAVPIQTAAAAAGLPPF